MLGKWVGRRFFLSLFLFPVGSWLDLGWVGLLVCFLGIILLAGKEDVGIGRSGDLAIDVGDSS